MRSTSKLAPFLFLSISAASLPAWAGGDGGGYNGPNEIFSVIPSEPDLGVSLVSLQDAHRACFFEGDPAKGLVSVTQRLADVFFFGGFRPVDLSRDFFEMGLFRRDLGWDSPRGYLAPRGDLLVDQSLLSAGIRAGQFQIQVFPPDARQYGAPPTIRLESQFPVVNYETIERVERVGGTGSSEELHVLQGLAIQTGIEFDAHGHAIPARREGYQQQTVPHFTVNAREYTECLMAEIQKTEVRRAPSPEAPAGSCAELEPWLAARVPEPMPEGANAAEHRSEQQRREWRARKETVSALHRLFVEGKFDAERIEACLAPVPDRQNFLNSLYSEFYEKALSRLMSAGTPGLSRFVGEIDGAYRSNHLLPLFRLTGHFDQASPEGSGERFAGVHRGTGSIYVDIAKVPMAEWGVIFIHEMAHKLDRDLQEAVSKFRLSRGHYAEFERWAARTSDPRKLPKEVREDLVEWLQAGLERGLWAEYRAWHVTFELYREGISAGLWQPIPRFEKVLEAKKAGEDLGSYLYRHFDSQAKLPEEGLLSRPLIRSLISELLQSYRVAGFAPPLGELRRVVRAQ